MFVVVNLQKCFMHVYRYIGLISGPNLMCCAHVVCYPQNQKLKTFFSGCYSTKQYMKKAGYFSKV